jgi:dehydrogenase/reductase SDR family protein 13
MPTDLANKVFIVTGANTGIGKVTAKELARAGAHVLLACRSRDKTAAVIEEIKRDTGNANVEYVALDLSDLASVRACADAILARNLPIHGLINNAGLAGKRGQTKDGFEMTWGTNHLGHCSPRSSRAGSQGPGSRPTRCTRGWSPPTYGATCPRRSAGS